MKNSEINTAGKSESSGASAALTANAVVFASPGQVELQALSLTEPGDGDLVIDVVATGVSTGTERLLFDGDMPQFPGMGYPLVPGYEAVGKVRVAGESTNRQKGELVFVPGARCYPNVRSLFGGASSRLVVPADRAFPINPGLGDRAVLLALAATAHHVMHVGAQTTIPDLIIGHGVVGRLLARLAVCLAPEKPPVVWETNAQRRHGAKGYQVVDPRDDDCSAYGCIADVSGDSNILDQLIARLAPASKAGGSVSTPPQIILAGFYKQPLSFNFAPAFMREARIQIAAEWKPENLQVVCSLVERGRLSLDGLITHRESCEHAQDAYNTAFNDTDCLKMVLDWRKYND